MRRVKTAVVILVGLLAMSAATAVGLQDVQGTNGSNEWPFGDDPRDAFDYVPPNDFVFTVGVTALAPGSVIMAGVGTTFEIDPFFTNSQTDITVLPTFAANHTLETGLEFDGWSASVDVDLSLVPWALVSTGGWLELHPPEWVIMSNPAVTLNGRVGWGPQWAPVGGWSHAIGGAFDAQTDWSIPTLWDSTIELAAESNLDATWTFPNGLFVTDWLFIVDVRSVLPFFRDSSAALRAGMTARVFVLPTFGLGFDMVLEFRADSFYAYGLAGAGAAGIRTEVGVEMTIGLQLFDRFSQDSEQE